MSPCINRFIHETHIDSLPESVKASVRYWLLDLLGVAAAGTTTELSRIIYNHAESQFGSVQLKSRLLFDGRNASPVGAALANGMTIDSIDAHDGHKLTKGHVGCGVLAGLLAFADAESLNSDEFLCALVIGYEIGTRAGIALHRTALDYHTSGAWVALAVAAVGSRLLKLDETQTREALGIAEYHAPRSQMMRCIDFPTMIKDGSGVGAMTGVSAAYLAKDGFTGAPALLIDDAKVADLWSDLGQNWRIFEQYYKPYPVCRWAQPSVQAVLNLRKQYQLDSSMVKRVEITTFHEAIRLATRHPKTTEQAQYSTAFPSASALVWGALGAREISDSSFEHPEVKRLSASISFSESDEFNRAFPANRFAEVKLHLLDGRVLASGPTEAIGDPEKPIPFQEVRDKFFRYATPVVGETNATAIESAVAQLGSETTLSDLLELILTKPTKD